MSDVEVGNPVAFDNDNAGQEEEGDARSIGQVANVDKSTRIDGSSDRVHLPLANVSWHLCVVLVACTGTENATLRSKLPLLAFLSFLMVAGQMVTVMGLFSAALYADCMTNDDCGAGLWCQTAESFVPETGSKLPAHVCRYCGSALLLRLQRDP
eukprot:SAG22_NODE_8831_length_627_cov_0.852273_1_plen_153_part_10